MYPMHSPFRFLQKDDLKLDATVYQAAPAGPPFAWREGRFLRFLKMCGKMIMYEPFFHEQQRGF